jgi:hypothetical protein
MGEAAVHRKRSGAEPARRAPRSPAEPTRRNPMVDREREVVVLFLLFGRGLLGGGDKDINVKIDTPAKTN